MDLEQQQQHVWVTCTCQSATRHGKWNTSSSCRGWSVGHHVQQGPLAKHFPTRRKCVHTLGLPEPNKSALFSWGGWPQTTGTHAWPRALVPNPGCLYHEGGSSAVAREYSPSVNKMDQWSASCFCPHTHINFYMNIQFEINSNEQIYLSWLSYSPTGK